MEIKLIAIDLDGTLLDSKKRLSEENRKVLSLCIEKGIWIVPCTGRTVDGIPEEVKNIPGVRYAITTNGAVVEDMAENTVLATSMLSSEEALELLRFVNSYHVMYDPYIKRRGITEPRFYEHLADYGLSAELQKMVLKTRDVHPSIIDFVENSKEPVEKINLFFADMEERAKVRKKLEKFDNILVTSSISNNLEINAPGATKGEGLSCLANHLDIKIEQTMAIGDGENDFSMILKAGMGVAMKNGNEDLLKTADYITESNDDSGVAAAIRRLVFGVE